MVGIRASRLLFLGWEQERIALPALIRELELVRLEPLDDGRVERWCLLLGAASGVTVLGHCLVPPAKGRLADLVLVEPHTPLGIFEALLDGLLHTCHAHQVFMAVASLLLRRASSQRTIPAVSSYGSWIHAQS